jgi:hypothetical protein
MLIIIRQSHLSIFSVFLADELEISYVVVVGPISNGCAPNIIAKGARARV